MVIPVDDEEPGIVDAVAGALAQGAAVLEVVVVVAGDADSVAQRVAATALEEPRVLVLREARHGRGLACRIGFDAARGDIIAGIGADVRLPSGWADAVIGAFVEHPEADVGGAPQTGGGGGGGVAVRASSWPAVRGALGDGGPDAAGCTVMLVPAMADTDAGASPARIARERPAGDTGKWDDGDGSYLGPRRSRHVRRTSWTAHRTPPRTDGRARRSCR